MYSMRQKQDRNRRLIEYRRAHPEMTVKAIGKIFHISYVRVIQLTSPRRIKP